MTVLNDIERWSKETFPASTFESTLRHFRKELREFFADPHDPYERADLVHLLVQLARLDDGNLQGEVEAKFEINKQRRWQQPDAQGVVEHEWGTDPTCAICGARAGFFTSDTGWRCRAHEGGQDR